MLVGVSDSGSNNITLSREMQQQLRAEGLKTGFDFKWKPKLQLIRCFCHKMGLIVKGGLDTLGLNPMRIWHSGLGRFPPVGVLAVIEEDNELGEDIITGSDEPSSDKDDDNSQPNEDFNSNNSSTDSDSDSDSDLDSDSEEEDQEQEDEPTSYRKRKTA